MAVPTHALNEFITRETDPTQAWSCQAGPVPRDETRTFLRLARRCP
ncbi:hypothetical protein ACH4PR_50730 [Streptomyces mirabilis]